jgi:hypothetical protein
MGMQEIENAVKGLPKNDDWSRRRHGVIDMIVANVPLPPDVHNELRRHAALSHQTTVQSMGAILARAAGR